MTEPVDLTGVLDTLSQIQHSLEALNATPTTAATAPVTRGVEDQPTATPSTRQLMSLKDISDMKDTIRYSANGQPRSIPELQRLLSLQAARKDTGIPLDVWANSGGYAAQVALAQNPMIQKALDSA